MTVYPLVYLHVYRSSIAVYPAIYRLIYHPREVPMDKQTAIAEAAAAVIEHGGPDSLTDPHIAMEAMGRALDLGAAHEDIAAEMSRQRGA